MEHVLRDITERIKCLGTSVLRQKVQDSFARNQLSRYVGKETKYLRTLITKPSAKGSWQSDPMCRDISKDTKFQEIRDLGKGNNCQRKITLGSTTWGY
jgi:hypothetical protein